MSDSPFAKAMQLEGPDRAKDVLRRVSRGESGAHAVLLYGGEGVGKTTLALAMAQAWLCPSPTPDGPCGECGVCLAVSRGRAVDLMMIQPGGATDQIPISAVSERKTGGEAEHPPVRTFLRTNPLMSRRKVVLMESADRMTSDAANALLKTLEEPTENSRLILTTSEVGRVLATIRSRCLCVACDASPRQERDWLDDFAPSPGLREKALAHEAVYRKLEDALGMAAPGRIERTLALSQALRSLGEELAASSGQNARAAHSELLESTARWLGRKAPNRPHAIQAVARAHRLIQGGVNSSLVYDSLAGSLLA